MGCKHLVSCATSHPLLPFQLEPLVAADDARGINRELDAGAAHLIRNVTQFSTEALKKQEVLFTLRQAGFRDLDRKGAVERGRNCIYAFPHLYSGIV